MKISGSRTPSCEHLGCLLKAGPSAFRYLENAGTHLLYLPPYSPDFNPIEEVFSKIKGLIRQMNPRSFDAICDALKTILFVLVLLMLARMNSRRGGHDARVRLSRVEIARLRGFMSRRFYFRGRLNRGKRAEDVSHGHPNRPTPAHAKCGNICGVSPGAFAFYHAKSMR